MIPLIFPVIELKEIIKSYRNKERQIDRARVLAKNFRKQFGLFVNEGREALAIALEDLRLEKEDQVIVPSYVCDIVPKVVERFATVVYAEINPSTLVVDAEEIKKVISERTKAVIVVHLYGKTNDLNSIHDLCRGRNLVLIEDCAQAIYSFEEKTRAGSLGDYTILSFRFSKDINLFKGGALLSNKPIQVAQKTGNSFVALLKTLLIYILLRSQRLYWGRLYYYAKEYFLNPYFSKTEYKLQIIKHEPSLFEQELVLEILKKMHYISSKKKQVASMYVSHLKDIDGIELCDISNNSLMRFNILASNREALIRILHENGIESEKMYSYTNSTKCRKSLQVSERIVNLPVHPGVSERDVEKTCEIIRHYYA